MDPPKPVTPITDAMQTGKEPLRSFSDLLQFMKKERDETVAAKPAAEMVSAQKMETVDSSQGSSDSANESMVGHAESTQRPDASDTSA